MRPAPPVRPVHAGRLPRWERLAFALMFALMIVFVVVLSISAARDHGDPTGTGGSRLAPQRTQAFGAVTGTSTTASHDPMPSRARDRRPPA